MVEALDQAVGITIEALETNGLLERTFVIFTSDNGGVIGERRITPSGKTAGSVADSTWPSRELFWHFPGYRIRDPETMAGQRPATAIRQGDWKMIESLETGEVQLYDLGRDVGEFKDVSEMNPEVVGKLRNRLHTWRADSKAPMPSRKIATPQ